ncbi:MAG: DUF3365 domain-containing protein [Chromatiales bacterium]|jgi:hypothetical protein|nr:DUF3365 domain-containing protein [Chromatiales bacterium]
MNVAANGWLPILMLAAGCTATGRGTSAPPPRALSAADEATWIARGRDTVAPFKSRLMAALQAGLAEGPDRAIDACRVEAPAIATASGGPGVTVGRSSHRLRNPANAPRPWVQPLLDGFITTPATAAPRAVALSGGGIGYVEPIVLQPMCVTCHGATLAPAVQARIAALYPADQATGFAPADLRGVFWVEFEPAALAPP